MAEALFLHSVSCCEEAGGLPDTLGRIGRSCQGSNQESLVRTEGMSCSRQGKARNPHYQVQGDRGKSRPLLDGVTVHILDSRGQEDLQGMQTLRL